MIGGLEAFEEGVKVPEGRWWGGGGWHRRWKRLEVDKIGLTTGLGRAYDAEAKIKADTWGFSLSTWCHLLRCGRQRGTLRGATVV